MAAQCRMANELGRECDVACLCSAPFAPRMIERGGGYFLNTASAAGLLNQIGGAAYGVTKHAAIGFGEWLALTYAHQGIKVSMLCPQAVRTAMTADAETAKAASVDGMMEPEELAEAVVKGLAADGNFYAS